MRRMEKVLLELGLKECTDLSPIALYGRETDKLINSYSYLEGFISGVSTRFLTEGGAVIRLKCKRRDSGLGGGPGNTAGLDGNTTFREDKYIVNLPDPQMDGMFAQQLYTYQQIIYEEALEVFNSKTGITIDDTRIAQHLVALVEYDNLDRASIENFRRNYEEEVVADIRKIIDIIVSEERIELEKVIHEMSQLQGYEIDSKEYQYAALLRKSIGHLRDLHSIYIKNDR